jgi:hypothetical protein
MRQTSQADRALQRYAREFLESEKLRSIDLDEFVNWILEAKHWQPDPKQIRRLLREDVSHALSEERFTDEDSRRVRKYHLIKRKKDDRQLKFWSPIENTSPKDMKLSLQVRRNDLVARAVQINNDQNHFNKYHNNGVPIQTSFNLENDVREADAERVSIQEISSTGRKRPCLLSHGVLRDLDSSQVAARP